MTHDLVAHWSLLELLWTAMAVLGVGFSLVNIREALITFRSLGGRVNGRRRISIGDIRREVVRLLMYGASILAGIAAGLQSASDRPITPAGVAVVVALLLIQALQVSQSILDRLDSQYLLTHGLVARDELGRFTRSEKE